MSRAEYTKTWRKKKSKDKEWKAKISQQRKKYYEKKKQEDPDFFNKKMKIWRNKKIKKDPSWNAERQREFRQKYPEKYNYMMARFYLRNLAADKRKELMEEVERGQN